MYCRYALEPPRRGGSNAYLQSMFWAEIWRLSESENFHFFYAKNFQYIWLGFFRNEMKSQVLFSLKNENVFCYNFALRFKS